MLRIGLWCAVGGVAAAIFGVIASGGFGPCGPQHMGPFVFALAGLTSLAVGILLMVASFFQAAFRKLKVFTPTDSH